MDLTTKFPMRIDIGSDDDADGSTGFPSTSTGINRSIAYFRKFCTHFVYN